MRRERTHNRGPPELPLRPGWRLMADTTGNADYVASDDLATVARPVVTDHHIATAPCRVVFYAPALGTPAQPERERGLFRCGRPTPCPVHCEREELS